MPRKSTSAASASADEDNAALSAFADTVTAFDEQSKATQPRRGRSAASAGAASSSAAAAAAPRPPQNVTVIDDSDEEMEDATPSEAASAASSSSRQSTRKSTPAATAPKPEQRKRKRSSKPHEAQFEEDGEEAEPEEAEEKKKKKAKKGETASAASAAAAPASSATGKKKLGPQNSGMIFVEEQGQGTRSTAKPSAAGATASAGTAAAASGKKKQVAKAAVRSTEAEDFPQDDTRVELNVDYGSMSTKIKGTYHCGTKHEGVSFSQPTVMYLNDVLAKRICFKDDKNIPPIDNLVEEIYDKDVKQSQILRPEDDAFPFFSDESSGAVNVTCFKPLSSMFSDKRAVIERIKASNIFLPFRLVLLRTSSMFAQTLAIRIPAEEGKNEPDKFVPLACLVAKFLDFVIRGAIEQVLNKTGQDIDDLEDDALRLWLTMPNSSTAGEKLFLQQVLENSSISDYIYCTHKDSITRRLFVSILEGAASHAMIRALHPEGLAVDFGSFTTDFSYCSGQTQINECSMTTSGTVGNCLCILAAIFVSMKNKNVKQKIAEICHRFSAVRNVGSDAIDFFYIPGMGKTKEQMKQAALDQEPLCIYEVFHKLQILLDLNVTSLRDLYNTYIGQGVAATFQGNASLEDKQGNSVLLVNAKPSQYKAIQQAWTAYVGKETQNFLRKIVKKVVTEPNKKLAINASGGLLRDTDVRQQVISGLVGKMNDVISGDMVYVMGKPHDDASKQNHASKLGLVDGIQDLVEASWLYPNRLDDVLQHIPQGSLTPAKPYDHKYSTGLLYHKPSKNRMFQCSFVNVEFYGQQAEKREVDDTRTTHCGMWDGHVPASKEEKLQASLIDKEHKPCAIAQYSMPYKESRFLEYCWGSWKLQHQAKDLPLLVPEQAKKMPWTKPSQELIDYATSAIPPSLFIYDLNPSVSVVMYQASEDNEEERTTGGLDAENGEDIGEEDEDDN